MTNRTTRGAVLGASLAAVLLAGCAAPAPAAPSTPQKTRFQRVAGECKMDGAVADQGRTLIFDTKGNDDASGHDMADVACVLNLLLIPQAVVTHIDSTRALDGQQTDTWQGINARWTYHPDSGLTLTLVDTET